MNRHLLQVEAATKRFGGLVAVNDVSFSAESEEIIGLIGPNGAGKTTLLNVISGLYQLDSGRVRYRGEDITKARVHARASHGILRTFQHTSLFMDMSVFENVLLGSYRIRGVPLWRELVGRAAWRSEPSRVAATERVLRFVGIADLRDEPARYLPLGQQRALGIAVALNSDPVVLLLDEPFSGVPRSDVEAIMQLLRRLKEQGMSIILVEHNMFAVMDLSDRVIVLDFGRKIAEGTPQEIKADANVLRAYLGDEPETSSLSLQDRA